jgi:PAS domain S-box-containing protein
MVDKLKILFVEDVRADAELIWREIEKSELSFTRELVDNQKDFIAALKTMCPDIIISDYSLPQFNGLTALLLRNEICPLTPFILVTGSINEEVAVECMKSGADDYILKENLSRLVPAIINSIKKLKLTRDKKKVEAELYKSEQRLQRAQAIAFVGNWELDLSTKIVWCSDEALVIYGLDKENHEIPYETIKQNPLPEYRQMLDEELNRLLKYNEPYEIEFKINRSGDGEIRSIFSKAELVVVPDSEQVKVLGVIQDITDRKKAEEALAFNNLLLRIQQESSIDGILVVDDRDKILNFNQRFVEIWGIPKEILESGDDEPVLQFNISQTAKPDEFIKKVKHLYKFRNEISSDEVILKDGRTLDRYSAPMLDTNGKYYGRVWYFRDVSEQKQSVVAINQERRMLRTLIDNIPDPIYVEDNECRKVIANKADVENIGFSNEDEVLGKTDLDLFPGKIGERGYIDDKKVITTGKAIFDLEEEFINEKGVRKWLQTTKIPLRDNNGNITGLVGIGHDITERKEIIEELIRSKEKAEESDKLKTAFLHNISHEIRTPMNAIVGFSALLGEPEADAQARRSYIDVIMQSSNHLLSIITDIVDISNIEANLIKTVKNEISVNSVLQSLCNQFSPKASEKNIKLDWESSFQDSDSIILTDRTKFTQVLSNLISNAIKFTDNGQIKLYYSRKNDFLEFSVADTGIGIMPQFHDRVFDRFYQVQSSVSRLYEGTGLGLAISKAYVELLGGKIWLTSEPGKGTTFFFTIPYEKALAMTIPYNEKKAVESLIFPDKKVILVAEDIESNFKLIRYFLAGSNAEVIHAFNGKEAVEKCFSESKIDLILMDMKMPVMDGYRAVKLIREKNNEIPIVAQTAYADDKDKAIECGCSGFISKPFDKKGLFRIISEFIK